MFGKFLGNEDLKTTFERLFMEDRLPQSSIFTGKTGIGKSSFALEIARANACRDSSAPAACNVCGACKRASKFTLPTSGKKDDYERVFFSEHPDVGLVIPNKQRIYVEAIRDLEREANFRPYEANKRFFVIDSAEKLTQQAANALLKTLEEPTETTFIILVTSRPSYLPTTIRSRCQTFRFAPVKTQSIEKLLFGEKQLPSEDAKLVARVSRGSVGKALEIDPDEYREQRSRMFDALKAIAAHGNLAGVLRTAEEMSAVKTREDFEDYLSIMQLLIHDLWKLEGGSDDLVNYDIAEDLEKFSVNLNRSQLTAWLEEIEMLRENLFYNLNRKISSDALFMKMAAV